MARTARPPDLRLLLCVAPLFAACDDPGPEARHCVDPGGVYVEDHRCDPGGPGYHPGAHYVYVPVHHYGGVGAPAGAFRGATSPGSGRATVSRGGFGATGAGHAHAAGS